MTTTKLSFAAIALSLTLTLAGGNASAEALSCIEQAKSSAELDQCGGPLVSHFEEKIESEYKRLAEKFTGNERMQEMLKTSRQSWDLYRNKQCVLEAAAASGGYVIKPFALAPNKIYFKCMLRTFNEMKSSLEKF